MPSYETVWEFRTERFRVALEVTPEEDNPADHFENAEDIEAINNGNVQWFVAFVRVYLDGNEVGCASLGGCAYSSVQDFFTSHRDPDPMNRNCTIMRRAFQGKNDPDAKISICHYFPGMVKEAISQARKVIDSIPKLRPNN